MPLHLGAVYLWSFSLSAGFIAAAFLFYWPICRGWARPSELRAGLEVPLALFILFFALSAGQSLIPHRSAVEAFKLAGVLLIFVATRHACRSRSDVRNLATALAVLGAFLSLGGLLQFLDALPRHWWHKQNFLSSVYVNHNHFAGFLEIIFPLSLGLAFSERSAPKKALFMFMCALMGTAFFMTLSRGGIFSLAVGLTTLLVWLSRRGAVKASGLFFFGVGALVAVALAAFGLGPLVERLQPLKVFDEEMSRLVVWKGALSMIVARPWLGGGPGTFESIFLQVRPAGFLGRPQFAHNDYLELWADCGLAALLAVMIIFIAVVARAFRCAKDPESRTKLGLGSAIAAGFIALGAHSLVDFNFHIPANWALTAVAAGLVFSLEPTPKINGLWARMLSAIVWPLLAVCVLAGSIFFGVSDYWLWQAKGLEAKGDLALAETVLDKSLRLNSYNPAAWYEKGVLLQAQRPTEAAECLKRSIGLNPYEPYYRYHLVRATSREKAAKNLREVAAAYAGVLTLDAEDAKLNFLIARDLFLLNAPHDKRIETYAKLLLARVLRLKSDYAKLAYEILWQYEPSPEVMEAFQAESPQGPGDFLRFLEGHSLWKYHRVHLLKSLQIDPLASRKISAATRWAEPPGEVFRLEEFKPTTDKKISEGRLFHGYGELQKTLATKKQPLRLLLTAKGSKANEAYPYILIKIDGKVMDAVYIDNPLYAQFESVLDIPPGGHTIGLRFINDCAGGNPKRERNIWIDKIELESPS